MTSLLDGRAVIISGSTRGIGRAMAELFAAEGARVVVNGRRHEDAVAVAAEIPGAIGVGGDLSDLDSINALVERVREEWGRVDVLVNNAAISRRSAVTRVTNEEWDEVIRVNLTGPMYLTRAVVPMMKAQGGGVILNVISGAGTHGTIGFSSYAASKGGLVGLTMTWAQELAPFGIRVNALSPAALTDMMRELPSELLDPMIGRLADPADVAAVALALVSDLSKLVNGQIIGAGAPGGRG
ncbi:MAG TPA: SDR family oxidoreductase [Acidimicrobiales bacterium]|nr:SDR family oxidoreductase [Acidimicrobiales bacterium]